MNVKDLITSTPWTEIETQLLKAYPNANAHRYQHVYDILCRLEANSNTMRIVIDVFKPERPNERGEIDVYGLNGTLERFEVFNPEVEDGTLESPDHEMRHELGLTSWENWLGMQLDPVSSQRFETAELIAHCLRELTFHGFEPSDICAFVEGLKARVQEILAMTPEERRRYSMDLEDALTLIAEAASLGNNGLETDAPMKA